MATLLAVTRFVCYRLYRFVLYPLRQLQAHILMNQLQLALDARDKGIKRAVDHANLVNESWSDTVYRLFLDFIRHNKCEFMCEDFREGMASLIPPPPNDRAFGGIFMRAAKAGLITRVRYAPVKNVRAHRANASVWKKA